MQRHGCRDRTVSGKSGTSSTSFGIAVRTGGKITSNSGNITVIGTGGLSTAILNYGVWVEGASSAISSTAGNVNVTGTGGGSGSSNTNLGVIVQGPSASITSSGGNVNVTGIGGVGASSIGIVTTSSGTITTTGGGSITLNSKSMNITSTVSASGMGRVTLRAPDDIQINLGTTDNTLDGPLGLSDAELDLVTGSSITIGHALAGDITVSASITHTASNISLVTAGDIAISGGSFSSGTGTLLLNSGASPKAVKPTLSGTDVTASSLSFDSDLVIVINGITVDAQYSQLNVAGAVNLSGAKLVLSGTHTPVAGQTFIIVNNDGTDEITGTFNGLPEGASIPNFLGSSLSAIISYLGDSGNDVLLTATVPMPVELVSFSGKNTSAGTLLDWHTAAEIDNEGFDIERSADGKEWRKLGFVPGHGTTQQPQAYAFVDERPQYGYNYYRLRQVDYDGQHEYSPVRSVWAGGSSKPVPVAYPNPTRGLVAIQGVQPTAVRVLDSYGREVLAQEGAHSQIDLSQLPKGLYTLLVSHAIGHWDSVRVMKQ